MNYELLTVPVYQLSIRLNQFELLFCKKPHAVPKSQHGDGS